MGFHQRLAQGQSESRSAQRPGAGCFATEQPLEQAWHVCGRRGGGGVVDLQHQGLGGTCLGTEYGAAPGVGIAQAVFQQVDKHLGQPLRVPLYSQLLVLGQGLQRLGVQRKAGLLELPTHQAG